MTAQPEGWSAEPWYYDERTGKLYDAHGNVVAKVYGDGSEEQDTANGHRIASLSRENKELRGALKELLEEIDTWDIGLTKDVEPHKAEMIYESIMDRARSALRAAAKGGTT